MKKLILYIHFITVSFLSCNLGSVDLPAFDYTILQEKVFSGNTANILLFGDSGTGSESQEAVAAGMITRHNNSPFDFAIMLGDNFYESGVRSVSDPQFDTKFRYMYPASKLDFPFYVILGNHDHFGNAEAQYYYPDHENRWTSPGPAYLLPLKFLDNSLTDIYFLDAIYLYDNKYGPEIRDWMESSINSRSADMNILAVHYPPYSSGEHGDDETIKELFDSMFSSGIIDITVSGHEHDLELQEYDADSDNNKELFIISGSAAKLRSVDSSPNTVYSASVLGFAELLISSSDPSATIVSFINKEGIPIYP